MSKFVLTAELKLKAPTNTKSVVDKIRRDLKDLHINLDVKGSDKAKKAIDDITKASKKLDNAGQGIKRTFKSAFKQFLAFTVASRAISLLTNSLSNAVSEAIEFEKELIKIQQVARVSDGVIKGLSSSIFDLAKGLGVSSLELAKVTRTLSQAGFKAQELEKAVTAIAKSDLAPTFENLANTTEGVIAIFNQFEKGAGAIEAQLGSINAVAGQFAVEAGDLIGVTRRVGGVFKAAGGSLNELIAVFTAVRSTTRESAESIATGLRTIFTRIQRPKTIEFLKELGINLQDVGGKFVGPFEAIKRLNDGLKDLDQRDPKFIQIAEQLGGFRQIGKVIPLLQQFGVASEALDVANEGINSLDEDAQKGLESLGRQLQQVREEFQELITKITDSKSFKAGATIAIEFASALIKLADAIRPLLPLITALAAFKGAQLLGGALGGGGLGGLGGGLTSLFQKPTRLNSGGMVPGVGNQDTVSALLTPGEFVIKKESAKKIGFDNLRELNEQGFNKGGIVRLNEGGDPNKIREELNRARKTTAKVDSSLSIGDTGTLNKVAGLDKLDLTKKDTTYGNAILRHSGDVKNFSGTIKPSKIKEGLRGSSKAYASLQQANSEKALAVRKQIDALASDKATTSFNLINSSLTPKVAKDAENAILKGVVSSVQGGTKVLSSATGTKFGAGNEKEAAKILKLTNIDNVVGNLYEASLQSAGVPFSGNDGGVREKGNATFDFPQGLSSVAKNFTNPQGLPSDIISDAKTEFNRGNLTSFIKKAKNRQVSIITQKIGAILQGVQLGEQDFKNKGTEGKKGFKSASDFAADLTKEKNAAFIGPNLPGVGRGFNSGGGVDSKEDNIPALLTPGEFVINKDAARQIGRKKLDDLNQGRVGFNRGGPVGKIQRFRGGGGAKTTGGGSEFDRLGVGILGVTTGLQVLAGSTGALSEEQEKFVTGITQGIQKFIIFRQILNTVIVKAGNAGKRFENFEKSTKAVNVLQKKQTKEFKKLNLSQKKSTELQKKWKQELKDGTGTISKERRARLEHLVAQAGVNKKLKSHEAVLKATDSALVRFQVNLKKKLAGTKLGGILGKAGPAVKGLGKIGPGLVQAAAAIGIAASAFTRFQADRADKRATKAISNRDIDTAIASIDSKFAANRRDDIIAGASTGLGIGATIGAGIGAVAGVGVFSAPGAAAGAAIGGALGAGIGGGIAFATGESESIEEVEEKLGAVTTVVGDVTDNFTTGLKEGTKSLSELSADVGNVAGAAGRALNDIGGSLGADGLDVGGTDNKIYREGIKELSDKFTEGYEKSFASGGLKGANAFAQPFIASIKAAGGNMTAFAEQLEKTTETLRIQQERLQLLSKAEIDNEKIISRFSGAAEKASIAMARVAGTASDTELALRSVKSALQTGDTKGLDSALNQLEGDLLEGVKSADLKGVVSRQIGLVRDSVETIGGIKGIIDNTPFDDFADNKRKTEITAALDGVADGIKDDANRKKIKKAIAAISESIDPRDVSKSVQQLKGDLAKLSEGAIKAGDALVQHQKNIQKLEQARDKAEQKYLSALDKRSDTEIRAAKLIEQFGGAALTAQKQLQIRRDTFNNRAKAVGVTGVGGGSAAGIRRASASIISGAEGARNPQERQKFATTQQALIQFTEQRLALLQEEIKLSKAKTDAERKALDALASGDQAAFARQLGANVAADTLESGGFTESLSIQDLVGGFNILKNTLSPANLKPIADIVAQRTGGFLDADRLAGISAAQSAEGQSLAGVLTTLQDGLAQIDQINLDQATIIIKTTNDEFFTNLGRDSFNDQPLKNTPVTPADAKSVDPESVTKMESFGNKFASSVDKLANTNVGVNVNDFSVSLDAGQLTGLALTAGAGGGALGTYIGELVGKEVDRRIGNVRLEIGGGVKSQDGASVLGE